jgi:outer membrane biogenesis lipoprotein LolB
MIFRFLMNRQFRLTLCLLPLLTAFLTGCAAKTPVVTNETKEDAAKKMSELGLTSKKGFNKGE